MNIKTVLAALVATALVAGPAQAVTLTNEDAATYTVEVIVGEGDASNTSFELQSGETLADVCADGCVIRLNNGAEADFVGDEAITIKDGELTIAE